MKTPPPALDHLRCTVGDPLQDVAAAEAGLTGDPVAAAEGYGSIHEHTPLRSAGAETRAVVLFLPGLA